jgi:hypothetical protein
MTSAEAWNSLPFPLTPQTDSCSTKWQLGYTFCVVW